MEYHWTTVVFLFYFFQNVNSANIANMNALPLEQTALRSDAKHTAHIAQYSSDQTLIFGN
jgi:hypothetical protein